MDFVAVHFPVTGAHQADQLIGQLSLLGFTGFEETPGQLIACIPEADLAAVADDLAMLAREAATDYELHPVPWKNWNQAWEQSFSPVEIDTFCGIRAAFHSPLSGVTHEIIITPRMTFGTGHHATTASMIRLMADLDLQARSVLDFGTGTGILAILAARMGADRITAIDLDPTAVENARENMTENGVADRITCYTASRSEGITEQFDCILANIQLGVILDNLSALASHLLPGASLITSGVLEADAPRLREAAGALGLENRREIMKDGWTATQFFKPILSRS